MRVQPRLPAASPGGLASPPPGPGALGQAVAAPGERGQSVLVLKLGALGNIVLSVTSFAAIRRHHPGAQVALLTTAPYAAWMAESPWFDRVLIDARPAWWDLRGVLRLRHLLAAGHFDRVYDLQTSSRSSHYFRLFPRAARPEWSGIAPGCSHPDRRLDRDAVHDIDRQHAQLRQAGIADFPPPDLSWSHGDIGRFALPPRFALLVPGSSAHRPVKRWPAAQYRALAAWLAAQDIIPVVVGSDSERDLARTICEGTGALDLAGLTGFGDLADLARAAICAVGNDTGPMHLLATAGCPSLVLFSRDSDPARCAPRPPPGTPPVQVLRRDDLAQLATAEVTMALQALLREQARSPDRTRSQERTASPDREAGRNASHDATPTARARA